MERYEKKRKFVKFLSLSVQERQLFLEALVLHLWVGLWLKIIPFRWIPKLFSSKVQVTGCRAQGIRNLEPGTLNLIKTAIQRSSPYSRWKNKCLVSSLAARRMLNRQRIPSQLSLGVAKGENGRLIAHAWVKTGDFEIVEKSGDYQELYLF